jgi:anti-sigma factor RsiW
MIRHLSAEQLSSYLDGEVSLSESREIEAHLESCARCRAQYESLDRMVANLWRLERVAPPPVIGQEVRSQVDQPQQHPREMLRRLLAAAFGVPLQPVLRTATAMGLAFVMSLFLVTHGVDLKPRQSASTVVRPPTEVVTVAPALGPMVLPETTSQVAGREFVWTEPDTGEVWVQRGLEGLKPEARVVVGSPQGRALLTQSPDLRFLLADGARVVLRYNLETVELSRGV